MKKDKAHKSEQKQNDVNIKLTFGDDSQEKKLIQMHVQFELGAYSDELHDFMTQEKNSQENDMFIMVKFYVSPGQEKQATEYLQKAMDEPDEKQAEFFNPIQQMLHRPKSAGRVYFQQRQGQVRVYYCLYEEYLIKEQSAKEVLELFVEQGQHPKIDFNFFVRGEESKAIKDKTSILPNYTQLELKISGLDLKRIGQIVKDKQLIQPQTIQQFPFFDMLTTGFKKIKLKANFNTFRKIKTMYMIMSKIQQQEKSDLYIHKNLLKNKIQVIISCKKIGLLKGQVKFILEDHLQRMASIMYQCIDSVLG